MKFPYIYIYTVPYIRKGGVLSMKYTTVSLHDMDMNLARPATIVS